MRTAEACGRDRRPRDGGFSLVEMLISVAILPMVLGAAYLAFITMSDNYTTLQAQSEASAEAQQVMDTMVREIRQAQEVREGGGAFVTATSSSCSFYSDLQRDGVPELVSYYVDGSDLYRSVSQASIRVYPYNFIEGAAKRVMNLGTTSVVVFTYYDHSAPLEVVTTANVSSVCAVGIHLSASRPAQQGKQISVDFKTRVKVRALFNSLS